MKLVFLFPEMNIGCVSEIKKQAFCISLDLHYICTPI